MLFLEITQRIDFEAFGGGHFRSLLDAIKRDQEKGALNM
jgi:4-hydroxyphenylpyruvate dioxygenase-like putative hemolysin